MADVGAENRLERRAERIEPPIEGDRDHAVVRLAAEIEGIDEKLAQVADLFHGAGRELVEGRGPLDQQVAVWPRADPLGREPWAAEIAEQFLQQVDVELRRIEIALHRLDIPLLEMLDEVVQQIDRPGDAALEEGEGQLRKAMRDAAEEQRAAEELGAVREVAEVIEHVVAWRGAVADAARRSMADRRDLELDTFAPERIVVVGRVHRDRARRLRRVQERVIAGRRPRGAAQL